LIVVLIQPDKGHVEKSIVINTPASAIFPRINNMKNFTSWSPWSKMDPGAKQSFEGAEAGVGSKMSWEGKKKGKGSQWVEESVENERVKTGLSFEGFDGIAYAELKLVGEGGGTKVTWTYDGDNNGFGKKAMCLKQLVESTPATAPTQEIAPRDSTATK
jgi:Polyketide cyclase / dehydrase and lipid transport